VTPIIDVLRELGFDTITANTGLPAIEVLLRRLADHLECEGADALRRETVIVMVTEQFKALGIAGAGRLVRVALALRTNGTAPPPPPPAPSPGALLEAAQPLLDADQVLEPVGRYLIAQGYAGDLKPPKVAYLALTSRVLDRPVNLRVTGPSASGKNFVIESVLPLFPPSAYYQIGGMSPLALLYSLEPFAHRTVIVNESSALHDDGIGASLLRGLVWDQHLTYDTVIDGEPVHLEKQGPTNLITTSTRDVDPQLDTRMWATWIDDTPEQTRRILDVTARRAAGQATGPETDVPSVEKLVALQDWLLQAGARAVVVPFAPALAALLPDTEVRLRRDVRQLIALIRSHALLHQLHRERDAADRVVATLIDYAAVRTLVDDVFAASVSSGATPQVREAVEAVKQLTGSGSTATVSEVATRLHLSPSGAWHRINQALKRRWLVNEEPRRRQPAKLRLGEAMPTAGIGLPDLDTLAEREAVQQEAV